MATDNHYVEPEPTGDETYEDPLTQWIGEKIIAEWAGRQVKGVVVDVELPHDGHSFGESLIVSTGSDVSISVEPEAVLSSTRDF